MTASSQTARLTADDRWEISDLMVTYTLAIDAKDYDLLASVLAEDVVADYGPAEGVDMKMVGRDAVLDMMRKSLSQWPTTHHLTGSPLIRPTAEGALLTCYLIAQHVLPDTPGGDHYIIAGVYNNDVKRTDDGWRIASIVLRRSWTEGNLRVMQGMYDELKPQYGQA